MRFCGSCGVRLSQPGVGEAAPAPVRDHLLEQLRQATVGSYEIRGRLGRGGMAAVYGARDLRMNRKVAIKVMFPELIEREGMVERFRQEVQTTAKLYHPNIVPIHTVGESDGLHYFVMRLVEGASLNEIVSQLGPLPIDAARLLLAEVADALHHAHTQGVVHRDVTPSNIMVDIDGRPAITDFGIAKAAEGPRLTQTGFAVGTPSFMSPEQWTGDAPVTPAADQYSFGIVAYLLLTGRTVFESSSPATLMMQHLQQQPTPIGELRPDCPSDLQQVVLRMLAKKPQDRWPSLRHVQAALAEQIRMDDAGPREALAEIVRRLGPTPAERLGITPLSPTPLSRPAGAVSAPPSISEPAVSAPPRPIEPRPASVALAPAVLALAAGESETIHASVFDEQGVPLASRSLEWVSADVAVATVSSAGLVTAVDPGETTVSAVCGSIAGIARITVTPARVASIELAPSAATLTVGETIRVRATVRDARGVALSDRACTWACDDPRLSIAVANAREVAVTALVALSTTITAACEDARATLVVSIRPRPAATLELAPSRVDLVEGSTRALELIARDAVGGRVDDVDGARWSSSDPRVATVDSRGTVTAVGAGAASIGAALASLSARAEIAVAPRPVARIEITPVARALRVGKRVRLEARTLDASGAPLAGRAIAWTTPTPGIATVSTDGSLEGVAPGRVEAIAESEGIRASLAIDVVPAPDRSRLAGPLIGALAVVAAIGVAAVSWRAWSGREPSVAADSVAPRPVAAAPATTDSATIARAQLPTPPAPPTTSAPAGSPASRAAAPPAAAPGASQPRVARADGASRTAPPIAPPSEASAAAETPATPPPDTTVGGVQLRAATTRLQVGQTTDVQASVTSAGGRPLGADRVRWQSSDPAVASVSGDGRVTASREGSARIVATAGGQTAEVRIDVHAAPPAVAPAALRAELEDVVRSYARAMEARDLARMRAIYPAMSASMVEQYRDFFELARNVKVTLERFDVPDPLSATPGSAARADVRGVIQFSSGRETSHTPLRWQVMLERAATGWRVLSIQ